MFPPIFNRLRSPGRVAVLTLSCLMAVISAAPAAQILFIGNSYTFGGSDPGVRPFGGVPKMVAAIANARGEKLEAEMLAVGGKDWGYHLQQPATFPLLAKKAWDWVVLQDFSTKATRLGIPAEFFRNGEAFYRKIRELAPQAKVLLYETWARQAGNGLYKSDGFGPAEMTADIVKNYTALQEKLEAIDPGTQVALAPVGKAFALCTERYPEIGLYSKDMHHANARGSYLAALVIYGALFEKSPWGATRVMPGVTLDTAEAEKLQKIATEALGKR